MNLLQVNAVGVQDRAEFIGKVYTMLGVSLLFCCGGALYGLSMPAILYWPMFFADLILLFVCMSGLRKSYPLNLMLLFLFTTVSGLMLGFILEHGYVMRGMGQLIPMATGITAVTFGGLSLYVHITKQDFLFIGGALMVGLIGMLLVALVGSFIHLPISSVMYGGFGVLLFSGFILYDTSNLVRRYNDDEVVAATLALYLDIVNMFLMVLRLLSGRRQ